MPMPVMTQPAVLNVTALSCRLLPSTSVGAVLADLSSLSETPSSVPPTTTPATPAAPSAMPAGFLYQGRGGGGAGVATTGGGAGGGVTATGGVAVGGTL